MPRTKAAVEQILAAASPSVLPRPPRTLKAQRTAAKVQLMKLKMKSKGNTSLPQEERVYFLVSPPPDSGRQPAGLWVSNKVHMLVIF